MLARGTVKIQEAVLTGTLSSMKSLSGHLTKEENLNGTVSKATSYSSYSGSYDVVPKVESQTLGTKDRYMNDDVTIQAIPIERVSNIFDGVTITIGAHYGE